MHKALAALMVTTGLVGSIAKAGTVEGYVSDSRFRLAVGATVSLINERTGEVFKDSADRKLRFSGQVFQSGFRLMVPAGTYTFKVRYRVPATGRIETFIARGQVARHSYELLRPVTR
jgi:hypothetical protein